MKRIAIPLLFLALLAAAPAADVEALLREGNTAFRRGEFAAAADLYDRAGLRTTEPALVAFNVAVAKYRVALESAEERAKNLDEARLYFRCCLDAVDPRRGRALHYLGACLLQQALDGDGSKAKEAVERLQDCLLEPGLDHETAEDARHNLALARLVLAQTPPAPPDSDKPPDKAEGDPRRDRKQPKERLPQVDKEMNPDGNPTTGQPDQRMKPGDGKREAPRTDIEHREGKTGSDRTERGPDGQTLDPPDARHLMDAYDRILAEQQANKKSRAKPAGPGVKNW